MHFPLSPKGEGRGEGELVGVWQAPPETAIIRAFFGEVAQLGERRVRNAKVGSSILLFSTKC